MGNALVTMGPAGAAMLLALAGDGIEPEPLVIEVREPSSDQEPYRLKFHIPRIDPPPPLPFDPPRSHGKRAQRRRAKGW